MDYFELVVLKLQKTFSGEIVDNYPAKGTKISDAIISGVSLEGRKTGKPHSGRNEEKCS